jgi:trehalose 6-phosphate phosphatase
MIYNGLEQALSEVNKGFGILVSSAPKESSAVYSLSDPSEVNLLVII